MTQRCRYPALMLAAWILLVGTATVDARPIRVGSGEHPNFSRLVLYFRDAGDWDFGTVEGGYEFRAGRQDVTYDLRRAFDLIPRDRIAALRDLGGGRLFLQVECRCYAEVFSLDGGEIVLDIIDGDAPPSASEFNQPLAALAPADDAAPETDRSPPSTQQAHNRLPIVISPARGTTWLASLAQPGEPRSVETAPQAPPPISEPVLPFIVDATNESEILGRVAQTEMLLVEQIGRAASQGLLEPDLAEISQIVEMATPLPSPPDQTLKEGVREEGQIMPLPPGNHVRIQSVYDRDLAGFDFPRDVTSQGLPCPDAALFDISAWGPDPSGGIKIGDFRTRLLAEFDKPTPDAAFALAQYYIFLTFGSEAKAVLEGFAPDSDRATILGMMADIVDDLVSGRGMDWARFQECDGSAPMWAILAQNSISPAYDLNEAAVYSAFSALPIHLRQRFGAVLAERLVATGRIELATRLREAVERGTSEATPATTYLDAQISMAEEDSGQALRQLEEVITSRSGNAAQALVDLLDYKLARDLSPSEREIGLAASFAFEYQDTSIGQELQLLEVLGLAQNSRFSEAFSRVRQLQASGEFKTGRIESILISLLNKLTENASDAQFLRYVYEFALQLEMPRETRLAVSQRLLGLGFFSEARQVIAKTAQVPTVEERRILARLALAEGNADSAIGYLAGLEDDETLSLRAQALLVREEFAGAMKIFERLGDTRMLERLAFRSGNWSRLAGSTDSELAEAAKLALSPTRYRAEDAAAGGVLAVDTDLLKVADDTRRVVEELLTRFSDG